MTSSPASTRSLDVPALRKGLAVLELLAGSGALTMAEIQQRAQLNKTMTFRILRVLREHGYVTHDAATHRYSLALKLLELGTAVAGRLDVVSVSQSVLDALRSEFQETTNLGVKTDCHVVYVAIAETQRGLRMASPVGTRDGLHCTALGKAILAFLPADDRQAFMTGCSLPQTTPNTITDFGALQQDLIRTRDRGYAIDNEENELGARCVGVPILDRSGVPVAAISVSGPRGRIGDERVVVIAKRLWRASTEIAQRLGHTTNVESVPDGLLDGRDSAGLASAADSKIAAPSLESFTVGARR